MKLKISKVKFSKEFHETAFYIQEREEIHVYSIEDLFKAIKQRGGTAIITIYEEDIGIHIAMFDSYNDKWDGKYEF